MVPEYIYMSKFINKAIMSHYTGCISTLLIYNYFFSNKKQFLAYLNTYTCILSYWLGFSFRMFYY